MATFEALENRVKLIVDTTGYRTPINIRKLLHESENEWIKRTFCTQKYIEYYIAATDYEYDDDDPTNIAFVKGSGTTKDTITDANSGFSDDGFAAEQEITVSGSTSNDGTYTIYSVAAATITLKSIGRLTSESGVADMTIEADIDPNMLLLPTDFVKEYKVEYGNYVLQPLHKDGYANLYTASSIIGDSQPYNYWIEGDYLHIEPRPSDPDTLRLWYHYYQTDDTSTSTIIPSIDEYKIVNHTIGLLYDMDQKPELANLYYSRFENDVMEGRYKYALRQHKQWRISR